LALESWCSLTYLILRVEDLEHLTAFRERLSFLQHQIFLVSQPPFFKRVSSFLVLLANPRKESILKIQEMA